jgi:CHASE3 domain sensor protein
MALRLPARFRLPPFLPAYALLCLVIAYAAGSLWLGLARLDAIVRFSESTAQSATMMRALESLQSAVSEVDSAGRGYALSGDEAYLQSFERGRRRIPPLLAQLRDGMRDDTAKLAMIEGLVPLIAEHTTLSASTIERRRSTPDAPYETASDHRGKESADEIRITVEAIEARERDRLTRDNETLAVSIRDARRDLYLMTVLTLLLALALFRAVKRLKAFLPFLPSDRTLAAASAASATPPASDAGIGMLLRDAALRIHLALSATPGDSAKAAHLRALQSTTERALVENAEIAGERPPSRSDADSVPMALSMLARAYSRPAGVMVKATIDQNVRIDDPQKAFLLLRSAEWALEAIAPRKHAGEVSLQFTGHREDIFLRVSALADQPDVPITLTPREAEEAGVLQRAIASLSGTLVVQESSTGLALSVHLTARS